MKVNNLRVEVKKLRVEVKIFRVEVKNIRSKKLERKSENDPSEPS